MKWLIAALATTPLLGLAQELPQINYDDFSIVSGEQEYAGETHRWSYQSKGEGQCELKRTADSVAGHFLRIDGIRMPILDFNEHCKKVEVNLLAAGTEIRFNCQSLANGGQRGRIELDNDNRIVRVQVFEMYWESRGPIGFPQLNQRNCRY